MQKIRRSRASRAKRAALALLVVEAIVALALWVVVMQGNANLPEATYVYEPPAAVPTSRPDPLVAFIGDSYAGNAGASAPDRGFVTIISKSLNWRELNLARGGTGYTSSSGIDGCGLEYCPSFTEMIPSVAEANPDIVFVSGGRNGIGTPATSQGKIREFYKDLHAALPDAEIIALPPFWGSSTPPKAFFDLGKLVKRQVESSGGSFIDVGVPLEGKDDLVAPDGEHPNDAGYALIAKTILAKISR